MLLVILGHLVPSNKLVWLWIFAFHMPFFFIMSGYCASEGNYSLPFGKYFIKYAKNLLIPSIVIRLIVPVTGVVSADFASPTWAKTVAAMAIAPLAEWFIMALFFSKLLFYWVHKLINWFDDRDAQRLVSVFLIALAFFAGETWNKAGLHNWPAWFPMPIDCGLIGLSFVIIGYWARREDLEQLYREHRSAVLTGGAIAVLTILWLTRFQSYTNVCDMSFGNSALSYYVFACVMSFYVVMLCRRLSEAAAPGGLVSRAVALLGRNTVIVYPGHIILFNWLNKIIFRMTGVLYVPMSNFKTSLIFVYFAVAVAVLIPLCALFEKVRRIIRKNGRGAVGYVALAGAIVLAFGLRIGLDRAQAAREPEAETAAAPEIVAENAYDIASLEDFLAFRDSVNAGTDYAGCTVVQTADIDLSGVENFEPIGIFDSGHYFCGTYDGAGHAISGLHIVREDNAALFPILGGTVCNLTIGSGDISGAFVGSFASHATTDGQARLVNCINRAAVHGTGRAGGIADNFNGRIVSCINTGAVTADSGVVGGIVSCSALDIQYSWSSAAPLFPDTLSFAGNELLDGEAGFVRSYNFRLGEASRAEKLSLTPLEKTGDAYAHAAGASAYYLAGQAWYYIASYWLDALLWAAITLLILKAKTSKK